MQTHTVIATTDSFIGPGAMSHLWLLDGWAISTDEAIQRHERGERFTTNPRDPSAELEPGLFLVPLVVTYQQMRSKRNASAADNLSALPKIPAPGVYGSVEGFERAVAKWNAAQPALQGSLMRPSQPQVHASGLLAGYPMKKP